MSVDLGTEVTMIYCGRFLALYKGIVPKIMRLGPGGAIMLLVYEYMHDYLTKRFLFIETIVHLLPSHTSLLSVLIAISKFSLTIIIISKTFVIYVLPGFQTKVVP